MPIACNQLAYGIGVAYGQRRELPQKGGIRRGFTCKMLVLCKKFGRSLGHEARLLRSAATAGVRISLRRHEDLVLIDVVAGEI